MISILPATKNYSTSFRQGNMLATTEPIPSASLSKSKNLLQSGDELYKSGEYAKAIDFYNQAISADASNLDVYLSLGKAYKAQQDYKNATPNLEKYVSSSADDTEALASLGDCYFQQGYYTKAQSAYSRILELEPQNDLAKRNISEIQNSLLSCQDPILAMKQKRSQSINNLTEALKMAKQYLPASFMKDMGDLSIAFDKTAKLGGVSNIAQYEHSKKRITVTDSYTYASPQIVSAYLVHEFVHAHDKDPYTSVTEEQDAYKKETEFWLKNSNGASDPELDYAADLYKKSPETLDARVAEIYRLRDPNIATVSPNHPPGCTKLASSPIESSAANSPLKTYDIIS